MAIVLNDVASPNNTSVINTNFQKIEDAINDDLLKREVEVGEANEMRTHLDMNSNKLTNLASGTNPQDAATKAQLDAVEAGVSDGADGEDGATGATGEKGDTGDTGATGAAGIDGEDGADGTGQIITIVAGTNVAVDATDPANPIVSSTDTVPNKVDIATFVQGATTDAEKLITYVVNTPFSLPVGLTSSNAYAEVVSTGTVVFDIKKNGASIGSVNFAIGTNIATFTFTVLTSFITGDRLQIVNQATADSTLADISLTIRGNL